MNAEPNGTLLDLEPIKARMDAELATGPTRWTDDVADLLAEVERLRAALRPAPEANAALERLAAIVNEMEREINSAPTRWVDDLRDVLASLRPAEGPEQR